MLCNLREEIRIIKARNLNKKIGEKLILDGINLEIKAGHFLTIFGPNGAGKSTLLKILSLLLPPSTGILEIDGQLVKDDTSALRARMGVVSHQTFLYDSLTAYENLYFYGRMYGVKDLPQRIESALNEVGLTLFRNELVRTFSRGMQQRLAIARAVIHSPSILYLDEPFTGLDEHAKAILEDVLHRYKSEGRTTVMISHDFEQGLALSDSFILLVKGRVVFEGRSTEFNEATLKEVYYQYIKS